MTVSALRQQIRDWCAARAEEQLRLLCEIAAIPSPSLHEERRAAFLLAWLRGRVRFWVIRETASRTSSPEVARFIRMWVPKRSPPNQSP